jgi:hypothetical protein
MEEGIHHLHFAGDGLHMSSLEASFDTGIRAANEVIKKMSSGETANQR